MGTEDQYIPPETDSGALAAVAAEASLREAADDALDGRLVSVETAKQWAANPDALIVGAITRDANGAATAASVVWPDGATGAYTATTVSGLFPGAVDAYTVTKVGAPTLTFTQPLMTRDAVAGAVITRPAITVA